MYVFLKYLILVLPGIVYMYWYRVLYYVLPV